MEFDLCSVPRASVRPPYPHAACAQSYCSRKGNCPLPTLASHHLKAAVNPVFRRFRGHCSPSPWKWSPLNFASASIATANTASADKAGKLVVEVSRLAASLFLFPFSLFSAAP